MNAGWVSDVLEVIAASAKGHPFLVGGLLFLVLLSTALHVLVFGSYLLLGMSKYFRRQAAEVLDVTHLLSEEGSYWREIFDVLRFRSMSSQQVRDELKRRHIDAEKTTEVVTALVSALVLELRRDPQTAKHQDSSDASS